MYTKQVLLKAFKENKEKPSMRKVAEKGKEALKKPSGKAPYSWTPSVIGGIDGKEKREQVGTYLKNTRIRKSKRADIKSK